MQNWKVVRHTNYW